MASTTPPESNGTRLAVLGLGAMGTRLARNYVNAGHDVVVWNRTPEVAESFAMDHGTATATTPQEAADGAEIVVSMVANDEAAAAVWLDSTTGALASMGANSIAIESSTITPDMARTLGAAASEAGRAFLEAPVVGSRPQADAGALLYLIGGAPEVVERATPMIDINAGGIRHVGRVGTAATMKLAINGLFGIQVAAYAEIVGLLARSDVDTADGLDILHGLPITSPGIQRILGLIARRDFAPNFPVELVAKDFGYLTSLGHGVDAEIPLTETAAGLYTTAAQGGQGTLDIAGIATRYL